VTGSTGKTTTKDLLASVLGRELRTVATSGNRNNELGVPLTLLEAGADTQALIVEMGMRGTGQIAHLCEVARPTHGLITNVGTSHIELLGDQDAIADAKGELVTAVPSHGRVFLNGDDEYSQRIAAMSAAGVTFYGLGEACSPRARDIALDDRGLPRFELVWGDTVQQVCLGVPGRHNVYNALAASAVALELGLSLESVAAGLGVAPVTEMRMEMFTTADDVTIINDAYNANPTSMAAAVETLAALRVGGKRVAVLGDMAELGSLEELAHFKLGEKVTATAIERLVTVGPRAARIWDGARASGFPADGGAACASVDEALELLRGIVAPHDAVLMKASRVMGLESVVEGLVNAGVR
jgi:UDP-N-acetylmuramoyl-tripeptide--D-alanyl-D-alanine ligase